MTGESPLLATKMHAPAPRDAAIRRERLIQSLNRPARLVVIAAPAGFGKTTLLTEWLASRPESRTAWLSLDARDDDPGTFWRYLLASIDAARGEPTQASALLASGAATTEAVLATLVNELHLDGRELVIVLDDLHVIADSTIHAGIAYLVDNLPAGVRLVIATRADPPLPLARLRARGDLIEVRAANLRFTAAEAAEYLTRTMGLAVDSHDVDALCERTEGWIAALQLAALSLQGRHDPTDFIAGFAGDDRYVVDYLVEEVLQRQTDDVRTFLLQTSILGRLCSDLCEAVTAVDGAAQTLEALDRGNLFLVPLDDRREWFRYHHLFAEMLRARLLDEQPGIVDDLHLRASAWFEQHGETADAITHAIEGHAFERAARLIKSAAPAMQRQRQEATLAGWYGLLPPELVRADPELGIGYAGVLLSAGRTDGVEQLLADAEAAVGGTSEAVLALRRGIALYGSAQAMNRGDLATALEQSAVAVALSADGSQLDRGSAHGIRGLVLWALGHLEEARATWAISLDALEKAGHVSDVLGGSVAMGDILIALGRRDEAEQIYRRGLALGTSATPPLRGTADMHVGLADLLGDLGDLDGARTHLAAAEALGEYSGLPQNRHRRRMALAKLRAAEGDPAAGIGLLDEAEALYTPDFFPEVRPIAALRIRLQIAAGALGDARAAVRRRGVAPDDELSYLREYDHITLVRLLLAEGDAATATVLIDRLMEAAQRGGRAGVVGELVSLRSLVEGTAPARRPAWAGPTPVSERELEVLRLLATDLSGPEIARHLVISLNTLRTHTKSIFTKLDVTSRREAVTRAAGLGLLKSPR
jgi:LuxR family maltose regulon positive regulatory protein